MMTAAKPKSCQNESGIKNGELGDSLASWHISSPKLTNVACLKSTFFSLLAILRFGYPAS